MEPLQNGVRAATPEELSFGSCSSNLWNIKTGQNNLLTGSNQNYDCRTIKALFRISILMLAHLHLEKVLPSTHIIVPLPFPIKYSLPPLPNQNTV